MAVCIAVIGKDNSPQFIACADSELELQCQYKVHMSLDIVEEKLSSIATAEVRKLYLGLLHSTEEHKIYGYVTNTKIKFIIIVKTSNVTLRDNDVHTMFKKLHSCYVNIVSNPFYIPGDPLVSRSGKGILSYRSLRRNCWRALKQQVQEERELLYCFIFQDFSKCCKRHYVWKSVNNLLIKAPV